MPVKYKLLGKNGEYRVGTDGSVWTRKVFAGRVLGGKCTWEIGRKWKKLKMMKGNNGYYRVKLGGVKRSVHRLVLESFIGLPPDGYQACHNDGNRSNNRLSNLRWDTQYNNVLDTKIHGTWPEGENNGRAKLTAKDVVEIRKISAIGRKGCVQKGLSHVKVAKMFNIPKTHVSSIVTGKKWKCIPLEVFK